MHVAPLTATLDHAEGVAGKSCRAYGRSQLPQPHVGIGHDNAVASLQRRQGIARDDGVGVSHPRGIEAVNAINHEVLIGFEVTKAMITDEALRQRALAAPGQATQ